MTTGSSFHSTACLCCVHILYYIVLLKNHNRRHSFSIHALTFLTATFLPCNQSHTEECQRPQKQVREGHLNWQTSEDIGKDECKMNENLLQSILTSCIIQQDGFPPDGTDGKMDGAKGQAGKKTCQWLKQTGNFLSNRIRTKCIQPDLQWDDFDEVNPRPKPG